MTHQRSNFMDIALILAMSMLASVSSYILLGSPSNRRRLIQGPITGGASVVRLHPVLRPVYRSFREIRPVRRCLQHQPIPASTTTSQLWFAKSPHHQLLCRTTSCLAAHQNQQQHRFSITDSFEGGNIEMVDQVKESHGDEDDTIVRVTLRIKPDVFTELEQTTHLQYFAFKCTPTSITNDVPAITRVVFVIENASKVSYPRAWNGSTVFVGTNLLDTNSWTRVLNTSYSPDAGTLTWTYECNTDGPLYFCYFPPFTYTQHLEFISKCAKYATIESLGQTLEGRDMECIKVGTGAQICWVIHRQHPGEPMASYFASGLLTRLLGLDSDGQVDDVVQQVLRQFQFYIVPLMCPDGAVRGHLRTNSMGANLNREWATVTPAYEAPTLERSPEVYGVFTKMQQTCVDVCVDVHGDEELPFNFLSGSEGSLHWGPRLEALHGAFVAAYCRANSDMQAQVGYPTPPPGRRAALNIATNAIADEFNCLSVTLEMPFKDCLSNPDPERGWSPNRSSALGASLLEALLYVQPYLRATDDFWTALPDDDAYIQPSRNY